MSDHPLWQRWRPAGLAAALAASLILPTEAVRAQTMKKGGTVIAAIIDNPPHLITGLGTNISTIVVGGQVFNTLIKVDRDFNVVPSLAKSWEASPDGLQYMFRLEPNVTWHDGKPFTSDDVKFTFLEVSGKYNSLAIAAYKDIASIETPDPLTVVVRLKAPDPSFFPWAFSQPNFAQIFPKHIYQGSDPRTNPANLKPIGTGPFVFKEWVRGSHIAFERNPKYFRADHVFIDKLIFQIIPEPGARQIALERGDVDHLPYFALATSSIDPLAKSKDVEIVDSVRPALGEIIMIMNLRHPILSNKAVRKAIAFGIDREVIVKLALSGRGRVATGPIRTDNKPFYTPDVPKYPRDLAQANKLLDEAGFPRQSNGTRFAIKLTYEGAGEGGALQAAGEIMREQLRAVGINLQLQPADAAGWMDTFSKLSFDLSLGSYGTGPDPKIAVSRLYLSSNIRSALGSNAMAYSNPVLDELLRKGDAEMNPEARAKLYQDAQRILVDDLPALWLWEKFNPIANRKGLRGLPSGSMHSEVFEDVGWSN